MPMPIDDGTGAAGGIWSSGSDNAPADSAPENGQNGITSQTGSAVVQPCTTTYSEQFLKEVTAAFVVTALPGEINPFSLQLHLERGDISARRVCFPLLPIPNQDHASHGEWKSVRSINSNESEEHRQLKWSAMRWFQDQKIEAKYEVWYSSGRADVGSETAHVYVECGDTNASKLSCVLMGDRIVVIPYGMITESHCHGFMFGAL